MIAPTLKTTQRVQCVGDVAPDGRGARAASQTWAPRPPPVNRCYPARVIHLRRLALACWALSAGCRSPATVDAPDAAAPDVAPDDAPEAAVEAAVDAPSTSDPSRLR
ncbi:MAG: hypothetical protein JWM10_4748, partial [Myxococcaceae bacterium]|nr:hypothetical protein [Myxococcaceae bacterium]